MPALFSDEILTQSVRDAIHALALNGRELLTREAHDLLEGVFGLHSDGTLEAPENLPALKEDEARQVYDRLKRFLKDEVQAGLGAEEAVSKLVKEIAFTHLNRLVAFKMLESSKLIRETVGRGIDSNGFKFYLADHPEDEAHWKAGKVERAYVNFLRWQAGEIAREVPVLFDIDNLPSQLFPRMTALNMMLAELNDPELKAAWEAEETIGWVYQFFNERENSDVFDRLFKQKKKIRREDIPAATQRFTPRWIVRYLVENTLGRLWMQMHPDSNLGAELHYLVPSAGEIPAEKLRPVKEISLLDPACGTMHFGLVAFDLFAEMYREELQRAGMPGWLDQPSVANEAEIPAAILEYNLFGIDIDLRATQLSALTLYIKAKRKNRSTQLRVHNLACADVLPFSTADLGRFLVEMRFTNPIFEKMLRRIREQLVDIQQVGSLLRIERELQNLIGEQQRKDTQRRKSKYGDTSGQPALLSMDEQTALDAEHYSLLEAQLIQALDFFRQQVAGQGEDLRFFTGEAAKSLRVLDLLLRRYDVVLANPPYMSSRSMNAEMKVFLNQHYPNSKRDMYAAFIERCAELTEETGRVGMITQQSFMFLSSYKKMRKELLISFAVETMVHTGTRAFPEIQGAKVNTTAFILRREKNSEICTKNTGTFFRLIHVPDPNMKQILFEQRLEEIKNLSSLPDNVYRMRQKDFGAIPDSPWAYWLSPKIRDTFLELPAFDAVTTRPFPCNTSDNFRFIRFSWEIIDSKRWILYSKGGGFRKWYGNYMFVIDWSLDARRFYREDSVAKITEEESWYQEGITYSAITSPSFYARYIPPGGVYDRKGPAILANQKEKIPVLVGLLNSKFIEFILGLLNPTISVQAGDIDRIPICETDKLDKLSSASKSCIFIEIYKSSQDEWDSTFIVPWNFYRGLNESVNLDTSTKNAQGQIDDLVFDLYEITSKDRHSIENELLGEKFSESEDDDDVAQQAENEDEDNELISKTLDIKQIAARWVSYAVGIVFGKFAPGFNQKQGGQILGSAVYQIRDFAIGSLPAPNEEEFNELVGTSDQFAYIDEQGGRHVFSAQVEKSLQALAVEDGIAVLEPGHPRDLVVRVEKALTLMLGEQGLNEVVEALGGESSAAENFLRQFLGKDYFTKWHFKWYRKRPIYWAIQSAKRNYTFILFHEKITRDTFYAIQREPYLDTKRNAVALKMGDLQGTLSTATGSTRKKLEKDLDDLRKLSTELEEFAKELESITMGGYNPAPDWIDDGVILRMAPLWKVIPIWKAEPKKYWERLEAGDFDWSRIAMNYWADRVKAKCKTNKSYAIAHGHEEWYQGG